MPFYYYYCLLLLLTMQTNSFPKAESLHKKIIWFISDTNQVECLILLFFCVCNYVPYLFPLSLFYFIGTKELNIRNYFHRISISFERDSFCNLNARNLKDSIVSTFIPLLELAYAEYEYQRRDQSNCKSFVIDWN